MAEVILIGEHTDAITLRRSLRTMLIQASNARKIRTSPADINKHVLLLDEPPRHVRKHLEKEGLHQGASCIVLGSEKNQCRDRALPHIERSDGAWFDFTITVRKGKGALELLAYDFELRLPPGMGAPFLRFDLNLPAHRNEERELRCHLHPGSDDILVPAPLMRPAELLALLIDGVRPTAERKAARAPTLFEVSWFKDTLGLLSPSEAAPPAR
ncbi:hypothetical protein [Polyangium spumosum]|uniref:Uncharacterized protein n=1 Tax=Polyangium spumosum TaxID=889282 RepID=A0A6N7Q1C7_9BACT|nr:hypothetical protein [Polyangium spumosum]MRG94771.1 hypothetical protein [Polyangium spumosum]